MMLWLSRLTHNDYFLLLHRNRCVAYVSNRTIQLAFLFFTASLALGQVPTGGYAPNPVTRL